MQGKKKRLIPEGMKLVMMLAAQWHCVLIAVLEGERPSLADNPQMMGVSKRGPADTTSEIPYFLEVLFVSFSRRLG